MTRYDIGFAFLISAAHHLAAGIYAVAHAAIQSDAEGTWRTIRVVCTSGYHGLGRLATLDQIARITLVTVDAQTRRHMILRDAQRVRSALQLAARIYALADAFADLEADLLRLALKIVRAVTVQVATFVQVVGIAAVTRRTYAHSILTDGSGTAFYVAALIYALVIDAGVVEGAWYSVAANAGRGISAWSHLHLLTSNERIAEEAVLATAVVASKGINAHRIAAACVPVALINIETLNVWIASEARWTKTLDCVGTRVAVRIFSAHCSRTIGLLLNAAAVIRIPAGTRIADTL